MKVIALSPLNNYYVVSLIFNEAVGGENCSDASRRCEVRVSFQLFIEGTQMANPGLE